MKASVLNARKNKGTKRLKELQNLNDLIGKLAIAAICVIAAAVAVAVILMLVSGREEDIPTANIVTGISEESVSDTAYEEVTVVPAAETEDPVTYEVQPEDISDAPQVTTAVPDETDISGETSRTIITSRVRKEYDNNSVYIDMENILQLPELPVGCEITALTILLRYYGFDADKCDMARDYLPKGGNAQYIDGELYKDSFFDYFIGDPFSRGYGCFSNAIEKAAVDYLADNGGGYTVKNISGCSPDLLYDYVSQGIPVLCWATDGMIEPEYYESWYDNATGEKLDWYLNEHCFVLAGFNMSADIVTLNDPMKGIIDYNINKFETRFQQMYSQAIVILKDEDGDISNTEISDETETTADLTEETSDTSSEEPPQDR